jgi:hypothetical protein
MSIKYRWALSAIAISTLVSAAPVLAGSVQTASFTLVETTPAIPGVDGQDLPNSVATTSGGETFTYTNTDGFEHVTEGTPDWTENYGAGTPLLFSFDNSATITLSNPVSGFDFGIQQNAVDPQSIAISVFNGLNDIGDYTVSNTDGSFLFFGVEATGADSITSISIDDTPPLGADAGFAFGAFDTPEPSEVTTLILGTLSLAVLAFLAKRRKSLPTQ